MHSRCLAGNVALTGLLALAAAFGAATTGCGGGNGLETDAAAASGSVGLELELGAGVRLNTIRYEITGNGFTRSGSIDVSSSDRVRAVIGGIPAGTGYTVRLVADAGANGGVACDGSASFDVSAGATSTAVVVMRCRLSGGTGSVAVEGAVNVCPSVSALSAVPSEARVGGVVRLSAGALDLDGGPATPSFEWSASGGVLATSGDTAALECTESGTVAVTVSVSDGDCAGSATIGVICTEGSGEEQPTPDVRINEVESSGGIPGDWVELYNADTVAADLSGWVVRDNDDDHAYAIPAGTVLAPGAFYVVEEAALDYGLGGADSVHGRPLAPDRHAAVRSALLSSPRPFRCAVRNHRHRRRDALARRGVQRACRVEESSR